MKKSELQDQLDAAISSEGPVFAKITTETQVIWVEVTGVKEVTVLEPPWQSEVIELQTKPIPEGVGARMQRPDILLLPGFPLFFPAKDHEPSPEAVQAVAELPDATIPAGTLTSMTSEQGPEFLPAKYRDQPIVIPNVNPEHEDPAEGHYGEIAP